MNSESEVKELEAKGHETLVSVFAGLTYKPSPGNKF